MLHLKIVDWFNTQGLEMQLFLLALLAQQICTLIVGWLPQSYSDRWWARVMGRFANAKFADARGTWKMIGLPASDAPITAVMVAPEPEPRVIIEPEPPQ